MVLESTMICVDNSEYMRNGDFLPTRLQAQQDAVNLVCHSKIRSNPENNVGLLTLSNTEVLSTLTTDAGRILTKLHQVQPAGHINLLSGIRVAHLALKHRQGKNHRTRIVVFVGSPVEVDDKELIKLAKKLKKEKVNVDIVSFGEEASYAGTEVLSQFVNTLNGKEGTGSHLVTIPPGPHLSDALISSPILQGEDGVPMGGLGSGGYEFGVDPNEDPELALALRVSMEEQRQRQEEEARRNQAAGEGSSATAAPAGTGAAPGDAGAAPAASSEEAMLEQALAMSMGGEEAVKSRTAAPVPDFASMTEEEQIAYAMQMSMQDQLFFVPQTKSASYRWRNLSRNFTLLAPSSSFKPSLTSPCQDEDLDDVIHDPAFLQSVLENLPGVDPSSEAVRNAMGALSQQNNKEKKDEKKN
nr:EOG090X08NC [Triops cancriformis]